MGLVLDHISKSPSLFVAWILGGFCLGVLLGPLAISVSYVVWLTLVCIAIALALLISTTRARVIFVIVMSVLCGVTRFVQTQVPASVPTPAQFVDQHVRVAGVVEGEVERRIGGQQMTLAKVAIGDRSVYGKVLVRMDLYPRVAHKDALTFSCRLALPEPIEGFRYDLHLESRAISAICYRPQSVDHVVSSSWSVRGSIIKIKEILVGQLEQLLPQPHAAFVSGLVFGGSSALSDELKDDFARTGTSHILAASGFNVSLFSLVLLSFLIRTPLGRRRGIVVAGVLIGIYVIAAGATPAVIRAACMASLLLIAMWIRRQASIRNSVLLVLALMLFVNPKLLLFDVGFQLSFVATIAILWLMPLWKRWWTFIPETMGIREAFVGSLAAIVLTLPIVLWHFGAVSLVAPFINLLILPLIPLLLLLTFAALAMSWVIPVLGAMVIIPVWALSAIILSLIHWYAAVPFALVSSDFSQWMALVLGGAMVGWILWRYRDHQNGFHLDG